LVCSQSMHTTTKDNTILAWGLLLFLSLVWGSSFILIKKSLIAYSANQVAAGRIVFAFLAFLPLLITRYKEVERRSLLPLIIVGLCGSGLPALLYATAQTEISSSVAGLLNALTPIFAFLLGVAFFGKRFQIKQLLGITLGFSGTLIIFFSRGNGNEQFPILMGMLLVLATLCYGISANTVASKLKGLHPLVISTLSFAVIGPWALGYLLTTDFIPVTLTGEANVSLISLLTLSLVGTFGANILFFKLIQITDAVFSSSVSFITPIVALGWGFLDGEYISLYIMLALALILSGVFMVKFSK